MGEAQRRPRGVRTGVVGSGEIVEVQGGHIVRATGRKDRHSKVCTAKGLRDRRVRLSAHTAIQFYDVQDRLGYDRPSKAVDWLIKNAKPAIDQLAQLPPWRPKDPLTDPAEGEKSLPSAETDEYGSAYGYREGSSFLPPPLDSHSIADTIKFPMTPASSSSTPYPSSSDLLSHGGGHAGDLRLSLHSVQDPIFHHQHNRVASLAFEAGGSTWLDPGQRATAWNLAEPAASPTAAASGGGGGGSSGGYLLGVPPQLVQNQFLTQWGPLQSSNPPSIRAWADPAALATAYGHQMPLSALRSSSSSPLPVIITASGDVVGFSGLHFPARIQGGEEEHGCADAPPSASPASHR